MSKKKGRALARPFFLPHLLLHDLAANLAGAKVCGVHVHIRLTGVHGLEQRVTRDRQASAGSRRRQIDASRAAAGGAAKRDRAPGKVAKLSTTPAVLVIGACAWI